MPRYADTANAPGDPCVDWLGLAHWFLVTPSIPLLPQRNLVGGQEPAPMTSVSPNSPLVHPPTPQEEPSGAELVTASARVAFAGFLGRLVGLLRDMIIGAHFGAGGALDAYLVASSLPATIQFPVSSAVHTSLVATYSQLLGRGRSPQQRALGWTAFWWITCGAVGLATVLSATAGTLVGLFAPGLPEPTAALAAAMLRVLAFLVTFGLIESWAGSLLNSHRVFGLPAFLSVPRNLLTVAAVLATAGSYQVWGLVWGTLLSFALVCGYLVWVAFRIARPTRGPSPAPESWRLISRLALPAAVGRLAERGSFLVDSIFASGLAAGSITALAYGSKLAGVPITLIGHSVSTVIYPTLSRRAGSDPPGQAEVQRLTLQGMLSVAIVLTPIAAVMFLLRLPTVGLVFGHGSFDAQAVAATASVLPYWTVAMLPSAWRLVLTRACQSCGDGRSPMYIAIMSLGVKAVLCALLAPVLSISGIALATAAAVWLEAAVLFVALTRKLGRPAGRSFWSSLARILASSALAGGVTGLAAQALNSASWAGPSGLAEQALWVGGLTTFCLTLYAGLLLLLRTPEASKALLALWAGRPFRTRGLR